MTEKLRGAQTAQHNAAEGGMYASKDDVMSVMKDGVS